MIDSVIHSSLSTPIRLVANLLWLGIAVAVVVALRRQAPFPALALLVLGAAAFAYRHARPWSQLPGSVRARRGYGGMIDSHSLILARNAFL